MPTRAQVMRSVEIVHAARERLKGILVIDFVVPDYYATWPKPCMGGWGRGIINVTPSGKVLPCHAAETIPGLRFDNVRDKPLAEIWLAGQAFQKFRGTEWMIEPCRSCERREIDWGGCRCQAFASPAMPPRPTRHASSPRGTRSSLRWPSARPRAASAVRIPASAAALRHETERRTGRGRKPMSMSDAAGRLMSGRQYNGLRRREVERHAQNCLRCGFDRGDVPAHGGGPGHGQRQGGVEQVPRLPSGG